MAFVMVALINLLSLKCNNLHSNKKTTLFVGSGHLPSLLHQLKSLGISVSCNKSWEPHSCAGLKVWGHGELVLVSAGGFMRSLLFYRNGSLKI